MNKLRQFLDNYNLYQLLVYFGIGVIIFISIYIFFSFYIEIFLTLIFITLVLIYGKLK